MKIKLIIIGIILLQTSFNVSAQSKLPPLSLKNMGLLAVYIGRNYNINEQFANSCTNSFIFMKFKISKTGEVQEIDFTKGAPPEIKDALNKAILSTNGFWKFDEKEKEIVEQKIFILPFIYYYQAGCIKNGEVSMHKIEKPEPVTTNVDMQVFYNVENIINFENKSYETLECTLLSPIRVSSKQ